MSDTRKGWKATQLEEFDDDERFVHWKVRVECRDGERVVEITEAEVHDAMFDSTVRCCGECECSVEPDGVCHNGWPSILLAMGVI